MREITVHTRKAYTVTVGRDLLSQVGTILQGLTDGRKVLLVTDAHVQALSYPKQVAASLAASGFTVCPFQTPVGEKAKTIQVYAALLQALEVARFSRADTVLTLGGGAVSDVGGFAAATFRRGIHFVALPTSLLAMVDASVGGKTAVNLPSSKNAVGAFYAPDAVLADVHTLRTLPQREFSSGMAEVIKYAVLFDRAFFFALQDRMETAAQAEELVARCVAYKAEIVSRDAQDFGERRLLNFGHTVGHAIEAASGYTVTHGEAVGMGMLVLSRAAERLKLTKEPMCQPLQALLQKYSLPTAVPYKWEVLLPYVLSDKKSAGERITVVLPEAIGHCVLKSMTFAELGRLAEEGLLP